MILSKIAGFNVYRTRKGLMGFNGFHALIVDMQVSGVSTLHCSYLIGSTCDQRECHVHFLLMSNLGVSSHALDYRERELWPPSAPIYYNGG
ncbi:hypothetical protein ACN38_g7666 [Penicillium nordicum]|uniref:Uncharacterized protein n=1 Tax=Penicillium nordicum TaxID=229535 RepID=A0A0M8P195_9EURO|nr:hypothetical protein ACN38_g7666 [Penicillium nordicum]